ncbi:C4-dicarboxylate transporter DcuA [Cutibacterium acnes JCM 18920]|nr:C4-dicarboxylate transporter DcuA [Cutibacterium acnes JCM 18920]
MIWFHLAVAIIFIIIGSRLGGVGVGLAGGAGCIVLVATGLHTKVAEDIPWTVIGIIMTVICAIAALQLAGGWTILCIWLRSCCASIPTRSTTSRR